MKIENVRCLECERKLEIRNNPSDYDQLILDSFGKCTNQKTGKSVETFNVIADCEKCNKQYLVILPALYVDDFRREFSDL